MDKKLLWEELKKADYTDAIQRGDHVAVAKLLNSPSKQVGGHASIDTLIKWAVITGVLIRLHDSYLDVSLPENVRSAAYMMLLAITSRVEVDVTSFIDNLSIHGLITESEMNLLSQMSIRFISRTEEIFGQGAVVTPQMIGDVIYEFGNP